jgi:Ribbon-helix-helix protein, copG family
MKSVTVRLPEALVSQLEAESRARKLSKSDIIRERLTTAGQTPHSPTGYEAIADLIGSVHDLPPGLSSRKKDYLKAIINARKRHR